MSKATLPPNSCTVEIASEEIGLQSYNTAFSWSQYDEYGTVTICTQSTLKTHLKGSSKRGAARTTFLNPNIRSDSMMNHSVFGALGVNNC